MKGDKSKLSNYIDNLQTDGQYFFDGITARNRLELSHTAFKLSVNRLAKKVRLQRVRADFYIIVPLEYRALGALPASWFIDDYMKHVNSHYYVGILSAAALHGVAHQQPITFQVITDKIRNLIHLGNVRIEFHYKKVITPNFSQAVKTATGTMQVSTPEMTACDLVRYIDAAAQINNVATVLHELNEQLNVTQLMNYISEGYIEISVIQRLGYLLEYLNSPLNLKMLSEWIQAKQPHYRLLVNGSSTAIVERNKRWRILVNEIVEPDL